MRRLFATALSLATMALSPAVVTPTFAAPGTVYDFEFKAIDGSVMKLDQWRGKALLIVNTASFCGYTGQYAGLQKLWSTYESKGLVVIGVPSDDFSQEPKSEGEIKKFCEGAFGVTFPLTAKQHVTGAEAHPLYMWLNAQVGAPKWNFHKYIIGRDGRVLTSLSTQLSPDSEQVTGWIEKALATKAASSNTRPN